MKIDALKATISGRGGVAVPNRFDVKISAPGLPTDSRDIPILCESCTLPGRVITSFDYQFLQHSFKIPNGFLIEEVNMTFILTNDYFVKNLFDTWLSNVVDFKNYRAKYLNEYAGTVEIRQLKKSESPGSEDQKVYAVRLDKAWPTAVGAITLDNNAENVVQKLSVSLAYQNFEVIT